MGGYISTVRDSKFLLNSPILCTDKTSMDPYDIEAFIDDEDVEMTRLREYPDQFGTLQWGKVLMYYQNAEHRVINTDDDRLKLWISLRRSLAYISEGDTYWLTNDSDNITKVSNSEMAKLLNQYTLTLVNPEDPKKTSEVTLHDFLGVENNRRIITYSRRVHIPVHKECIDECKIYDRTVLNTFRGYRVHQFLRECQRKGMSEYDVIERGAEGAEFMRQHMLQQNCNGNKEEYDYRMMWWACVFFTDWKPQVSDILYSELKRTGKSIEREFFTEMIAGVGNYVKIDGIHQLVCEKNGHLDNVRIVYFEEGGKHVERKFSETDIDKLKTLVSDADMHIRKLYAQGVTKKSYSCVAGCTNHLDLPWVVQEPERNRVYAVRPVRQSAAYFAKLRLVRHDMYCAYAFYAHLRDEYRSRLNYMEITTPNFMPEVMHQMSSVCECQPVRFLRWLCGQEWGRMQLGTDDCKYGRFRPPGTYGTRTRHIQEQSADALYAMYLIWRKDKGELGHLSQKRFCEELNSQQSSVYVYKVKASCVYYYPTPRLLEEVEKSMQEE